MTEENQCGGPQETCMQPGCEECGTPSTGATKAISELTNEAKELLRHEFAYDDDANCPAVDRAVDCIIMASALTMAKWQADFVKSRNNDDKQ